MCFKDFARNVPYLEIWIMDLNFENIIMVNNNQTLLLQYLQVDEVFHHGALTEDDGQFKCEDIVRLLKYGEGNIDK